MRVRPLIFFLMCICHCALASRTSVAVFPLKNDSGNEIHDWIGYGMAQTMSRWLRLMDGFQVWDPVFLVTTDSSCADMSSDSSAVQHRNRWLWDVAVGGKYRVSGDSILARCRVFWSTGKEEPLSVEIGHAGRVDDFFLFTHAVLLKIFGTIQHQLSPQESSVMAAGFPADFAAYRTFASGYGFEIKGNRNAAVTAYERAVEIDPRCVEALCREGVICQAGNRFAEARSAFERAFAGAPADPYIAAAYADFLLDCDVPATAMKFINTHRALLEKSAEGMKVIGKMFIAAGEFQRAVAQLTRAVAFGPSDLAVEFALGSAYSISGDYTRAADIFNHLIRYQPYCVRYYASLGAAYRRAGRLMESTIVLESAAKITPDNTMILVDLAHTYIRLGWFEKAGQLLLKARDIFPLQSDISVNLGVVYWYENRKEEALKCFQEAAAVATTRQSAMNNMGNLFFWEGSPKKAIEAYRAADEAGRKNETVLYNLASAYLAKGDLKRGAYYYDQMLRLVPDRIDVLVQQASIADKLGRTEAAEAYYHSIIGLLPDHEDALRGLVRILLREKRYKEAVQPIEDFLARQPMNREIMLLLASVYRQMAWYEVALMKYQVLVREYPSDSSGNLGVGECMYALIKEKGLENYDDAILALKKASDCAVLSPVPDMLIGNIYSDCKGYRELAVDHWKKALQRAKDKSTRKFLEKRLAGK